jgi:ASCH domain
MRALSVRQPWAELIIRGHKSIDVRHRRIKIRGPVYIYAGLNRIDPAEEARIAAEFGIDVDALPRGVLIGSVSIAGCRPLRATDSKAACFRIKKTAGLYAWRYERPLRAKNPRPPRRHPQPVFFHPF